MMLQRNDGDEQIESPPIDFAFVAALPIERDALLRRLEGREVIQDDYEPLTYYRGHISIPTTGEDYQVVAVMLLGMGNDEAAVSTVKVIERWRPAYVLMLVSPVAFPARWRSATSLSPTLSIITSQPSEHRQENCAGRSNFFQTASSMGVRLHMKRANGEATSPSRGQELDKQMFLFQRRTSAQLVAARRSLLIPEHYLGYKRNAPGY